MLSRCFQEVGFDVMAVDHSHNRFHPLAHICTLDLTLKSSWEFLYYVVRNFPVCFVHAAPPCGTYVAERERFTWVGQHGRDRYGHQNIHMAFLN